MNDLYQIKLMMNPPDLVKAIDVAYRTTIMLAKAKPVEFVCGTFNCGECNECKTCDTIRKAEEWEWRYQNWKESTYATGKNKR